MELIRYRPQVMHKVIFIIINTILLTNCQNDVKRAPDMINETEKETILEALSNNMSASITDLTESQRKPTNQLILSSYYPLSSNELKAIKTASQHQGSFSTDLVDRINCSILKADLMDEKGEKVDLADTIKNPLYVQRFGLWDYNQKLCQNIGISLQTNRFFSELEGSLQIKLEIDNNSKKLIDIPVKISIKDIVDK